MERVEGNNISSNGEKMLKVDVQLEPNLLKEQIVENVTYRSTGDFHITKADFEKARRELKETAEVRKSSLKNLREMLTKDTHIRYRMDDDYLIRFLRYRKFDCKQAYKCIHNFYSMRNDDPQLFTMPPEIDLGLNGKFANIMPYLSEDGTLLFIHKFGHWNPAETDVRELLNMFSYVSDIMTMNPHAQINGVMDIWDFGGTTASHLSAMIYPSSMKLWTKFVQDVYPWRIKKVVLFNCHAIVYTSLTLIRFFLKKKLSNRLVVLRNDVDELHKHINPAILPKEFGGYLDDEECYSYLNRVVTSNKTYLKYENSYIGYRKDS